MGRNKKMAPTAKAPIVKKSTFQDNVTAALKGGKASAQAVLKYVAAQRNVPVEKCRFLVKVTLKKMVDKKLVQQLKGTGATGSFKLTKAALAPPKAKKPVKKTLKKVTKKVTKKSQLRRHQNHLELQRNQQQRRPQLKRLLL